MMFHVMKSRAIWHEIRDIVSMIIIRNTVTINAAFHVMGVFFYTKGVWIET